VSEWGKSSVEQWVTLYRDCETIDCVFRINWQEQYHLLKLAFETHIEGGVATCETPYGYERRATAGLEFPGQKWLDLGGHVAGKPCGLALLNDCKYGFDVREGTMRITLLRSPRYAHHDPWRLQADDPVPIIDQGWQTVRVRLAPHANHWQDACVVQRAWELNEPPIAHYEYSHAGPWPGAGSFLGADCDHVLLTVLKKSEDGEDVVVRGYETAGRNATVAIQFGQAGVSTKVTFNPYEIKTLRINPKTWETREVNLREE